MPDQKSRPDELMNPYAPPRTDPYQKRPKPAESSIRDYTSRIFVLRMFAMLHFVFALVSTVGANFFLAEGVRYGTIVKSRSASVCIVLGALSLGVGVGLWRLRRWASQLASVLVFFLLVLGSSTGMYQLFTSAEPSGFASMVFGIILLPLAGFTRSRHSKVVCSDAYWN